MTNAGGSVRTIVNRIWGNATVFLSIVFLLALVLRLGVMVATASYHLGNSIDDFFGFGTEMGRVARSLVQGNGFSSPMPLPTGPTAIVGPVYPLLLAVVFKTFGTYTVASAVVILTLQCVVASATCCVIYLCGRDTVGASAGKLSALIWALFPLNILFSATRIWETSLSALIAVILFRYMLPLRNSPSVAAWAKVGALLALTALVNTSLVVLAVPFVLASAWRFRSRFVLPAIVAATSFAAVTSPWIIRNYLEFGKPMLRSNFPLEFRVANNEWSRGQKVVELHPARSVALNMRWRELGEARFMAEESELNRKFLSTHPRDFIVATLSRVVNYWTGAWIVPTSDYPNHWPVTIGISLLSILGFLGAAQMVMSNNSAGAMYAGCFALYPVVYYLTTSQPRFYHAIAPLVIISGAGLMVQWIRKIALRSPRFSPVAVGASMLRS